MALTSWKAFPFFTASQVPVPADEDGAYLFENDITCIATSKENLFLGDDSGHIRQISQAFKVVRTFQASDTPNTAVRQLKQIAETPFLVAICEDLPNEPTLRVWDLDKTEKRSIDPKCLCTVKVQNGRRPFPVSALAVLDDLTQVAVGFANGSVTIIRGDFIHDRGTKQRTVFESQDPITGLEAWDWEDHEIVHQPSTNKGKHKQETEKRLNQGVTLSGLLNALDGPNSPEGHVVFMTSNHPEKLDAALIRQGRIDQSIKLDYAGREQLRDLFRMFYAPSNTALDSLYDMEAIPALAEVFADLVPEQILTPSQVLGNLYKHLGEPEKAVQSVNLWLEGQGIATIVDVMPDVIVADRPASAEHDTVTQLPRLKMCQSGTGGVRFCEPRSADGSGDGSDDGEISPTLPLRVLSPRPEPESSIDETQANTNRSASTKPARGWISNWFGAVFTDAT